MSSAPGALRSDLASAIPAMLELLRELVDQESPSADLPLVEECAALLRSRIGELLGAAPDLVRVGGKPHLLWQEGAPRVLLLGHFDTVWPRGTSARWPFRIESGRATGPGIFDMKAGIVQALFAVRALGVPPGVAILLTSDEELGSETSRELIAELGRATEAALVLEASLDGALKIARKGVASYTITVEGLAAHASQPELGVNATHELAHVVLAAAALADPDAGTTCSPTVAAAGTVSNTIPAQARLAIDSRAPSEAEQRRVDAGIRALRPQVPGARLAIEGGPNRAPMPESISRDLFDRARRLARELGLPELRGALAPGGSDGQLTAAVGTPTLDGLGAVGGNAHAEGEFIEVEAMAERAALVAALVRDLLS